MSYTSTNVYSYSTSTYTYTYPNTTTMSNPMARVALGNAIADVLVLPHSAVTINTFTSLGYSGCGSTGGYCSPSTTATLTVLYQGTGLTTTSISNAFTTAINALRNGFNSQAANQSPLALALSNYGFPNTNNVYSTSVTTTSSSSFPRPTANPSTSRPTILNLSPTFAPIPVKFTGAPSSVIPALNDGGFQFPSLGTLLVLRFLLVEVTLSLVSCCTPIPSLSFDYLHKLSYTLLINHSSPHPFQPRCLLLSAETSVSAASKGSRC